MSTRIIFQTETVPERDPPGFSSRRPFLSRPLQGLVQGHAEAPEELVDLVPLDDQRRRHDRAVAGGSDEQPVGLAALAKIVRQRERCAKST